MTDNATRPPGSHKVPEELRAKLASLIASGDVVLFMKGTREAPRCGFSASVVEILDDVLPSGGYQTVDVLADQAVREGIKVYSDWPTIPQLYIRGELVGGADIARELAQSGELYRMLGVPAPRPSASASVVVTPAAARILLEARSGEPAENRFLRLAVSPRFQHQLGFSAERPGDVKISSEGVDIVVDPGSARRADGVRIDVVEQADGGMAFRIENPNEPPTVKQMSVRELKQRLDDAKRGAAAIELFDVRTPGERATASIDGSVLLDDEGRARLEALPKDVVLVFHCHHGGRSQAAAEHYLKQGFKTVYNVAGGIDAWSQQIDPSVARY